MLSFRLVTLHEKIEPLSKEKGTVQRADPLSRLAHILWAYKKAHQQPGLAPEDTVAYHLNKDRLSLMELCYGSRFNLKSIGLNSLPWLAET